MSDALLGVYGPRDLTLVRGEGSYVWDDAGRRYLDCVSGVAVNALGHGNAAVRDAIVAQAGKFLHASNLYVLPTQRDLAARLRELSGLDAVFFSNSGTEANEGAIKFARRFFDLAGKPEKNEIVSFLGSFHGRTYASMAATGQAKIRDGFGPLPAGFVHVPANDVAALKAAVGPNTAAVLYEPIQAEGGVVNMEPAMAAALKEIQAQGVLLIADEIQCGLWRMGTFLGSEALGLKPDLVTLAKPLGGGLPLGAVLVCKPIAEALHAGDHGSTFGGNPVACAAGLAVVSQLSDAAFQKDYQERVEFFRGELSALIERKQKAGVKVGVLRGRGFLAGMQWGNDSGDVGALQKRLRDAGMLAHRAGADVLRLLPPLTFSRAEISDLIAALDAAMI
ncbi:MAG TPA: acetylornithine transaminase [Fibrobacteria bacterium]|jgi:predicted acetylornithine/succinylornithine family transaminase|nr:acetylornithine transaminase [Fibrobacteria bacterium]